MVEKIDCELPENEMMDECMHEDHDDHDEHGHDNPMMANMTFLMTAMFGSAGYLLQWLRYRGYGDSGMEYYTTGDQYFGASGTMNYWKMADTIRLPAGGAIWTILFITQAISMFSVAGEINMMAWMYLIPVWMLANMVASVVQFVGYDAAYTRYASDTTTYASALTLMTEMSTQMVMFMAKETAITMGLAFNHKGWMMGQIKMLPEEAQEKYMKKMGKGKDDHDDHDDHMDEEFSLLRFYGF